MSTIFASDFLLSDVNGNRVSFYLCAEFCPPVIADKLEGTALGSRQFVIVLFTALVMLPLSLYRDIARISKVILLSLVLVLHYCDSSTSTGTGTNTNYYYGFSTSTMVAPMLPHYYHSSTSVSTSTVLVRQQQQYGTGGQFCNQTCKIFAIILQPLCLIQSLQEQIFMLFAQQ